jgi:carbon monoxide dehydrogenase subunit G
VKIEGEYVFNGPREEVWKIVRDPELLSTALPGTQSLEQVSENEYEGEINVRIGPVGGEFAGRVVISDEIPPESCTMSVEGKGKPGFVKGTGNVQLIAQDDEKTLMKYEGEVQIGGRLASVGQRLIDTASKSMINQGLDTLDQALQARIGADSDQGEIEYKPPSETEFAASVAKDMAGSVFSSQWVTWIAIAVVVILIILVIVFMSRGGG